MYAVLDNASTAQLMDVYLAGSVSDVQAWTSTNFDRHYNGNRQPFGIYVHPSKSIKTNIILRGSMVPNQILFFVISPPDHLPRLA